LILQCFPFYLVFRPGLLAAFPKLVGGESQHTFIETENVRYLYQPLETLYLIVITTRQSNIMEDLDTLRTLAKLVRRRACLSISL
jgi:hypothetical protein